MTLAKKKTLTNIIIITFVLINLLFIFLQIHKQSRFVKLSYSKQRLEKERDLLTKQQNELVHKLYVQQSRKHIKKFATNDLGMRNTSVKQVHKVDKD